MEPLRLFTVFAASVLAGTLGALLGLGGGIILVPALVLVLGVPEKTAVATSLLGVIATSVVASTSHLRYRYTNIPLAMWLVSAAVLGALLGSMLFQRIEARWIALGFVVLQTYVAWILWRRQEPSAGSEPVIQDTNGASACYVDHATGVTVCYTPSRLYAGWGAGLVAGVISALLGVGGGIIKVPVMNLWMNVPLKAAAATSSFMLGMTGSVSAAIYLLRGYVDPTLAAPSVLGVMAGAHLGAFLSRRMRSRVLRHVLIALLVVSAIRMAWRVF
ncbi:MAG: sulfite exporter TauE/SafE family protein [Firmicutes bacterium]|nr:sulfite exporter TauE/SafE family protein [Bacillota bacterium]